ATETMDTSGRVTPSTSLEIAGSRVGGVPVELTPQGLVAGSSTHPVPINETLNTMLKQSGITVEVVSAQTFPGRVVAPALKITMPFAMPFQVPNVGQFSGTATVIIGSATAELRGAETGEGLGDDGIGGIGDAGPEKAG